ncbi:Glutathione S-transferase family protein [Castellaniella defragrans 65Phen]|uniref:Glutathione S-transferase family protein n=2 Tax=Castellaniella defragrans TaxID=75697 RepID=W8X340_CASD6|nr:glutathione S-transferase N-terminal domain-containing protein [Castellaniella defragrans]KAB0623085.1 glutathione S-transferase [Castellaniella defragrans]MBB6082785.1 glutathione S-transferase [Castellaniella defragrans]CDM23962.1 Glutathione S-transferase family protein [Castellaniella defragrans 65Phen]
MKLIGSLTSPYVRKVRIVLAEKKLDYELVLDDPWGPATHVTAHNPLGKVPCLIMDENGALFDSRVIVEYLDTLSPVGRLIPPPGRERVEVKRWEAVADGVMDAAAAAFIEAHRRPEPQRNPDWIARQHQKIGAGLNYMEQLLGEQSYCMGVNLCLADIAVGAALGYLDLRFPELDWRADHAHLARLTEKLDARPSFATTRPPAA